jgi:hypothetical protein
VIEPNTDDDGWMLIFPITIVFIEFFIALISWLNRKLSGKEVFKISDKGLEDIYCNLNFMIFFVMLSAELIPWSAINEFKIFTWTGGRKYVVAVINEDRLSPRTLKLFKLKAGNSSFGLMKGLYFGSRNAKMSADELIKILKQYQQKYTK